MNGKCFCSNTSRSLSGQNIGILFFLNCWIVSSLVTSGAAEKPCASMSNQDLEEFMKDKNLYYRSYMAMDLNEAIRDFPDFTSMLLISPVYEYSCDEVCQARGEVIQNAFQRNPEKQPPTRLFQFFKLLVQAALRASDDAHRIRVQKFQVLQEFAIQKYLLVRSFHEIERERQQVNSSRIRRSSRNESVNLTDRSVNNLTSSRVVVDGLASIDNSIAPQVKSVSIRRKRTAVSANTIGQLFVITCTEPGREEQPHLLQLCGSCRAIRELPVNYYPRYINQVLCSKDNVSCLDGHGTCVQRFVSFEVLRNTGSAQCQSWESFILNIPVCCDCMLSSQSKLKRIFFPDNS